MIAIKKARKFIQANPAHPDAQRISALVLALESEGNIAVGQLYQLDYPHFELALEILAEWRLDRYYASKLRLLDLSAQISGLKAADEPTGQAPAAPAERT